MTPEQIAWWWCCQAYQTRLSLIDALGLFNGSPFTTPREIFDIMLELHGFDEGTAIYNWWWNTFQVSVVEVEIDGVPIEFVFFNAEFWVAMNGFAIAVGFDCPEPCYILKFALEHM